MRKFQTISLDDLNGANGGAGNAPTIRAGATPQEVSRRLQAVLEGGPLDQLLDPQVTPRTTNPTAPRPAANPAAQNPANPVGDLLNQLRGNTGNTGNNAPRTSTPRATTPRAESPGSHTATPVTPAGTEDPVPLPRARPVTAPGTPGSITGPTDGSNYDGRTDQNWRPPGSGTPAVTPNPTIQRFDDGSSIQRFDDGSTLVRDSAGNYTSTPAKDFDQAAFNREFLRGYEDLASPQPSGRMSEVAAAYANPATREADNRFQPAFDQAAFNREFLRGYEDPASPQPSGRMSEVAASYANPATREADERFQPAFDQAAYNRQALAGYEDPASPQYNYAPTATNYGAFGEPPTGSGARSEVAASYANPATRANDERFQPAVDQAEVNRQALAGYEDPASPPAADPVTQPNNDAGLTGPTDGDTAIA